MERYVEMYLIYLVNFFKMYKFHHMNKIKIFYIIILLIISQQINTDVYANQSVQNKNIQKELEYYYLNKMSIIYVDGYDVDINGNLIQSQYKFEKSVKEISNEMLSQGFNPQKIDRIKDKARQIGQESRRSWDDLRQSLLEDINKFQQDNYNHT